MIVIESTQELILKGPGGFISISAKGITIESAPGRFVDINCGGVADSGSGCDPTEPELAELASAAEPQPGGSSAKGPRP